ncbi:RagB/SusD family nutrient uptake outer membrane protein [Sphingobacterium sp. Mn56C]|uniref:RagB/SusD family nutrient uptake outer membrane protein n=1 Tax=Sphingobacterium sp. Mn56C TaxID=3395261 RepID=UPI003BE358F1
MKILWNLAVACICLVGVFSSCKDYLNVQPEDKYTEEQVFANENAIQQALNGLYMSLSSAKLYGANLSTTTIEIMGQRYNTVAASNNSYIYYQQYAYANENVMQTFNELWTEGYATITKVNKFIASLAKAQLNGIISKSKADLLTGEAIGIRAMLHFDLLRLYGPVYATGADKMAIPYYTVADGISRPILEAKTVVDSVLSDYSRALSLLQTDAVRQRGVLFEGDFYGSYRNLRLNYYAIRGLQARTLLYAGKNAEAAAAAKDVLEEGEKWFPWLSPSAINQGIAPDRIFSTEVIFGVYNQDMYSNFTKYFSPELLNGDLLTALPARLVSMYEGTTTSITDYRYTAVWLPANVNPGTVQTTAKFADIAVKNKPWRFLQPLLRKTELYYILAEAQTDNTEAIAYLNKVRINRGIATALAATAPADAEIQKEYQKELWGEGQLFFYYKRKNRSSIPAGTSTGNITMNDVKYVVPLPLSETTPR